MAAQRGVARAPPSGQSEPGGGEEPTGAKGRGLAGRSGQWERGGAGPGPRHVRPRTCPRGAAAGGAGPAPGPGAESGTPEPRHRHGDTGTATAQRHSHRPGNGDSHTGSGTLIPAQRYWNSLGCLTLLELNAGRGSPAGATPAMEPPARTCSCGSPASDSEAEAGSSPRSPPRPERSRKRPAGLDRAPPESPPSPRGGKRPRKGEGGDVPPSDGDRLFAQKCRELRGFIRPLAELLEGLRRGRYDRGLSSFQQSVAMDRLQRIIGVLQKPEMGARYLGTLLQVEAMLRLWFPHVAPKPTLDSTPSTAPPRRRPPAGPPGAPRCRRLPGDLPLASPAGTLQQRGSPRCQAGTPESPPAPDV
ncbi:circadian-associated transcriptional repressor [Lonchura striata]